MTKEKNFISAVVYVHNDGSHITEFLTMLENVLKENFEHSGLYDIWVPKFLVTL